ncbi:MAG TPA: hypothetical protein V6D10_05985 [Trichocoleus sp.]|jgi:hypothetical protein
MPSSKLLPTSMRRLRAQFHLFKRPMVWGSGAVLLLAIAFLAQYWQQPGQFLGNQSEDPALRPNALRTSPSASDANSFDSFGNLPELTSPSSIEGTVPVPANLPNLGRPTTGAANQARQQIDANNPFASATDSANRFNQSADFSIPDLTNPTGIPITFAGTGATSSSNAPAATTPTNATASTGSNASPLQSALDRTAAPTTTPASASGSTNSAASATSETAQSQTTGAIPTTGAQLAPTANLGAQPLSPQPIPGQPTSVQTYPQQFYPQTSPPPGTTGYSIPPSFRTQNNSSSFYGSPVTNPSIAPTPSGRTTTSPTPTDSGYTSPQTQSSPFSVPRTTPGRTIGGGQINTFSNP